MAGQDIEMNVFASATDGEYIYGELSDGSQVKIRVIDLLSIILSKVNTLANVTYNTPTLIAEGVGFLIIQESWTRIDVSVFFISKNKIRKIFDDYNSATKLSIDAEKVYWTETVPSYVSIRKWFFGLEKRFATS
ncbi:hypothetical protein [Bacteroides sp.]|uniref:hypothetical protein n=1 Tax=Bacteroides sp. TaxID=29523 RepID=UPI0026145635|nr:hypothetical protein [Bacteroides sp.]